MVGPITTSTYMVSISNYFKYNGSLDDDAFDAVLDSSYAYCDAFVLDDWNLILHDVQAYYLSTAGGP